MGSKKGNQAFTWNGIEEKLSGVYLEWDRIKVVRRLPGMGSKKGNQAFTWNGVEEKISGVYLEWDRIKVVRRLPGNGIEER